MPKAGLAWYLSLVYSCRGNQEDGSGRCWCRSTVLLVLLVLLVLIKSPIHLRVALDLFDHNLYWSRVEWLPTVPPYFHASRGSRLSQSSNAVGPSFWKFEMS